jgi:hypothetical protein
VIGYTQLPQLAVAIERRLHLHQPNPATTQPSLNRSSQQCVGDWTVGDAVNAAVDVEARAERVPERR